MSHAHVSRPGSRNGTGRSHRSPTRSAGGSARSIPEALGGGGRPLVDALVVIEEVAKVCQLAAFAIFEASTGPARVIDFFGTDEQKETFLLPVARGEATIAVAMSEPDAGQAAVDHVTRYVVERQQFGRPLVEFQLVQAAVEEMLMQTDAARLLIRRAADGAGSGSPDALETSLAKCFANEAAERVSDVLCSSLAATGIRRSTTSGACIATRTGGRSPAGRRTCRESASPLNTSAGVSSSARYPSRRQH
jgi:alkylation response protein AidB-like acyl-CoA dehydrogenase